MFGMLSVDDEFFVIVRPVPGGASLLLSDATAGLDYDIAADVLDLLHVPVPDDDESMTTTMPGRKGISRCSRTLVCPSRRCS